MNKPVNMKIRMFFLTWLEGLSLDKSYEIDMPRFFNLAERAYFFEVMKNLASFYPNLDSYIEDYGRVEQQRFQIMDKFEYGPEHIKREFAVALKFCKLTNKDKRQYSFKVDNKLSQYIVDSRLQWYGDNVKNLIDKEGNYLFTPSILGLPPKELVLEGLNALLLDLRDYSEHFSYLEFLELVGNNLEMDETELDSLLLEFVVEQVIYYRTLIPIA